jgi:hypothetical protein
MTAKVYPDHYTAADIIADVIWTDEGALRGTVTEAAQALKDSGRLMPAPKIIRTVEELKALDHDCLLIGGRGQIGTAFIAERTWLPAAVVAPAEQVRAARKALEEA